MTTRSTNDELASYGDGLAALGFHPGTVRAYKRALREFLESHPEALGADAVVNIRYASSAIMQGAAEVIAYGTAVRFRT